MPCPHLEYRSADEDHEFDHERPYCGVKETFVSPMRADVCNDRFDLHHAADCEVYRGAVGTDATVSVDDAEDGRPGAESNEPVTD